MKTTRCPCCRQFVVVDLPIVGTTAPMLAWGDVSVPVQALPARVLSLLAEASPNVVPNSVVEQALWGSHPPAIPRVSIAMAIQKIRQALDPIGGWEVEVSWGRGYRLVRKDGPE